ncbi:MAG: hypothetical protein ACYCQM_14425 [Acidithiobacillus sp.]
MAELIDTAACSAANGFWLAVSNGGYGFLTVLESMQEGEGWPERFPVATGQGKATAVDSCR